MLANNAPPNKGFVTQLPQRQIDSSSTAPNIKKSKI